jgi:hypothetical protein
MPSHYLTLYTLIYEKNMKFKAVLAETFLSKAVYTLKLCYLLSWKAIYAEKKLPYTLNYDTCLVQKLFILNELCLNQAVFSETRLKAEIRHLVYKRLCWNNLCWKNLVYKRLCW